MISAELRKRNKWSSMRISLFVEINRLTIEYTAWNSRRCNIFLTVWWSTYRKINACARSQNDNMRYSDLTIVSISLIMDLSLTNVDLERRFIFRLDDRRWQSRDSNLRLSNERRKRENDINNHNSHILFYQPFPVLQMKTLRLWSSSFRIDLTTTSRLTKRIDWETASRISTTTISRIYRTFASRRFKRSCSWIDWEIASKSTRR
jgi:hypothetical protein